MKTPLFYNHRTIFEFVRDNPGLNSIEIAIFLEGKVSPTVIGGVLTTLYDNNLLARERKQLVHENGRKFSPYHYTTSVAEFRMERPKRTHKARPSTYAAKPPPVALPPTITIEPTKIVPLPTETAKRAVLKAWAAHFTPPPAPPALLAPVPKLSVDPVKAIVETISELNYGQVKRLYAELEELFA